jgi:hypothetical protein
MQQCRYLSDAATHAGLASSLLHHVQLASNAKRHNVSPAQLCRLQVGDALMHC